MLVHRYDAPDRFVAGTIGQPGERTFFLQARQGHRITSVACEKQQVSVLAENLSRMLDEVVLRGMKQGPMPEAVQVVTDTEPLDAPITEEFRVGTMTLAWEANTERVVIELFSTQEAESDDSIEFRDPREAIEDRDDDENPATVVDAEPEAAEVFVVSITALDARNFVARAEALVAAGRPPCPFCSQPIEPEGHICPRANGYRRPLF